jgi:methyl-accepting chemotaxis protein
VIQQNAGAAEEMSSTSEELASQAEQLQSTIAFFKTSERGGPAAPTKAQRSTASQVAHIKTTSAPRTAPRQARAVGADLRLDNGDLDDVFERY